jgi:hypothetical protein
LRFRVPFSTSRLRRVCPTEPAVRTIPLRRFRRRPARFACEPISAASARAVLRSRRRGWVPVVVADVFRGLASFSRAAQVRSLNERLVPLTSAAVGVLVARSRDDSHRRTRSRSTASIARPHPAGANSRLDLSEVGHSPRPFLARGVPDPSRAPQPGRAAWVLPSCRPAALMGFFGPSQVCSRSAGGRARRVLPRV